MPNRLKEISVMNVILAFLVIFIHVSSSPLITLDKAYMPYAVLMALWRLSSFVVQGFLFLAGLKMFLKEKINYKKFYISRFKNIVIPYIIWVLIYYLHFYRFGYFPNGNHTLLILRSIFAGDLVSHFYFVIAIVQFYLLAPLWSVIVKKTNMYASLVLSFAIMILSARFLPEILLKFGINFAYNDRVFTTYLFYFVSGCFAGANYEKFKCFINKYFYLFCVLFIAFASLDMYLSYLTFTGIKNIVYLEYVHILYCISAIMFVFGVCMKIRNIYNNLLLQKIDGASYYIYLSHCLVILVIDAVMANNRITQEFLTFPLRTVYVYLITVCGCMIYNDIKKYIISKKAAVKWTIKSWYMCLCFLVFCFYL